MCQSLPRLIRRARREVQQTRETSPHSRLRFRPPAAGPAGDVSHPLDSRREVFVLRHSFIRLPPACEPACRDRAICRRASAGCACAVGRLAAEPGMAIKPEPGWRARELPPDTNAIRPSGPRPPHPTVLPDPLPKNTQTFPLQPPPRARYLPPRSRHAFQARAPCPPPRLPAANSQPGSAPAHPAVAPIGGPMPHTDTPLHRSHPTPLLRTPFHLVTPSPCHLVRFSTFTWPRRA